jgi:hypothetical protein
VSAVTPVSAASQLYGVSCQSASLCYAVGPKSESSESLVLTLNNGVPGVTHVFTGLGVLSHIACVPGGACLVTGFRNDPALGMFSIVTGGVPSSPVRVNGSQDLYKATCPSSQCIAVGERAHFTMGVVVDISI